MATNKKKKGRKNEMKKKVCKGKSCNTLIPRGNLNRRVINDASFGTSIQQSPSNNSDMLLNLVNVLNRGNESKFNDINQNFGLLSQRLATNNTDLSNKINASNTDISGKINASKKFQEIILTNITLPNNFQDFGIRVEINPQDFKR